MTYGGDAWHALGLLAPAIWITAFAVTFAAIALLIPILMHAALAAQTDRSLHRTPTPQWGGVVVVATTLAIAALAGMVLRPEPGLSLHAGTVFGAALLLLVLGAVDDVLVLGAAPKLLAQAAAVGLVIWSLPHSARLLPFAPAWAESAILFVAVLWFVNLVNFMDGLDWMMVAEVVPVTAGLAVLAWLGALPTQGLVVGLALNGAMLGFAPFNRPIARLFLGDMGSLPIGLLLGWLLLLVATTGHLAAAVLLPLYFVADASLTLFRRLRAGERVWEGHRSHFYQRAVDKGMRNEAIVARIFLVNLGLAAMAALSVTIDAPIASGLIVALGAALVAWLLADLARGGKQNAITI